MSKKKTTEEFKKEVYEKVGDEYSVLGEYINSSTKIKMKHNICGFIYKVTPSHFIYNNSRCPLCNGNMKKTTKQFKQEVFELVGDEYSVLESYKNNKVPIKMRHNSCGYIWNVIPKHFVHTGSRCPLCACKIRTEKLVKSEDSFKKEVFDLVGNEYKILSPYINADSKIIMKHTICGHVWETIPDRFLRGCRCRWCNQSTKEKEISKYLNKKKINFRIEYKITELIDKAPLRFDFAIFDSEENLQLLIEYNEKRHYNTYTNKEDTLYKQRDQMKIDYCYENNIPLLMIPYTEDKNIEEILQETLINLGLLSEK